MGKKEERKLDSDAKLKKRERKKREGAPKRGIVDVLSCPPVAHFHYELVVGNGIGDDAVEDALEAFRRAFEARRQKAYDAARAKPTPPARLRGRRAPDRRPFQQRAGLEHRHRRRAHDRHDLVLGRVRVLTFCKPV